MDNVIVILKRELASYFATPLAYIFMVIYLFLSGVFTLYLGNLFAGGEASLQPFFMFHPWLYLLLIPAITMRLWAEERKSDTIELLLTLPVTMTQAVLAKFLAAWLFIGMALVLTFPLWITVNYLGQPDNGIIVAGYLGSLLMAGAYLAIGSCISALTKSQVIAFVISLVICFAFVLSGHPMFLNFFSGWAPQFLIDAISSFSFITHFNAIIKGVIDLRDLIFFLSLIGLWLFINVIVIELKKAD